MRSRRSNCSMGTRTKMKDSRHHAGLEEPWRRFVMPSVVHGTIIEKQNTNE